MSLFLLIPLAKLMNQKRGNYNTSFYTPLKLEPPFPIDDNTRRSRANLGPSYGNTLVENFFEKYENPYKILRVHMRPWACVCILNSYVRGHEPTYAVRVPETSTRQVFYKISAEAVPHRLESPPPLLFEHYKRSPQPLFPKHTESTPKKWFKEKLFYFEKHPKLKFLG